MKGTRGQRSNCYCSHDCFYKAKTLPVLKLKCDQCDTLFERSVTDGRSAQRQGTKHSFCSARCSGLYGAAHKTKGTRRSKLECWLESQLRERYPNLDMRFNETDAIQAELDIYVPSLNLAFELNGIFHYESIYGQDKLDQTQNKDRYKLHACTAARIDLCGHCLRSKSERFPLVRSPFLLLLANRRAPGWAT